MNITYIAKSMIPSQSANSVHVMKIAEAFSELVDDFTLIVPEFASVVGSLDESFAYYDVEKFAIRCVKIDLKNGLKNRYLFPWKAVRQAFKQKPDVIVTRDPIVAFLTVCSKKQTVLDMHGEIAHLCGRAYRMIKWRGFTESKYLHLVMISEELRKYYHEKYQVPMERMTVLPDGYTAKNFKGADENAILKKERLSIGYCGGFMAGKGIGIIAKTAGEDRDNTYHMYGGDREKAEKEIEAKFPTNVEFHGYIPNAQVPEMLQKHDILLLPNQEKQICKGEDIGKVTSPLKMFEYMASGRVIIASDIPVLREILNEQNSYLVKADDPQAWVKAVRHIETNREEAVRKAERAKMEVNQYSWKSRARKMLELVEE